MQDFTSCLIPLKLVGLLMKYGTSQKIYQWKTQPCGNCSYLTKILSLLGQRCLSIFFNVMTNSFIYCEYLTNYVYLATRNHLHCLEAPHIVALMDEKLHLPFHNLCLFFFHGLASSLINLEISNS